MEEEDGWDLGDRTFLEKVTWVGMTRGGFMVMPSGIKGRLPSRAYTCSNDFFVFFFFLFLKGKKEKKEHNRRQRPTYANTQQPKQPQAGNPTPKLPPFSFSKPESRFSFFRDKFDGYILSLAKYLNI